jgi:hypothetical protein
MLGARRARREVGNMEGKLRAYWPLPLRVFLGIAHA